MRFSNAWRFAVSWLLPRRSAALAWFMVVAAVVAFSFIAADDASSRGGHHRTGRPASHAGHASSMHGSHGSRHHGRDNPHHTASHYGSHRPSAARHPRKSAATYHPRHPRHPSATYHPPKPDKSHPGKTPSTYHPPGRQPPAAGRNPCKPVGTNDPPPPHDPPRVHYPPPHDPPRVHYPPPHDPPRVYYPPPHDPSPIVTYHPPRIVSRHLPPGVVQLPSSSDPGPDDTPVHPRGHSHPQISVAPPSQSPPISRAPSTNSNLPVSGNGRFVPDEVLFTVAGNAPAQAAERIASTHRLVRIGSYDLRLLNRTVYHYRIPDGRSVPDLVDGLSGDARVASVQPNYLFSLQEQPEAMTPAMGEDAQYALRKLRVPEAHRFTTGARVLVAVIDSGIDTSHPDLKGTIAGRYDLVAADRKPDPHGTAVAGAIASHGYLLGVAPSAHLLAVRAFGLGSDGVKGTTDRIVRGIDWATRSGARIINMSFTGERDPILHDALAAARERGLILVAAAGNAGPKSPPLFPASDPNVIAVTATDWQDNLFPEANRGKYIAVAAPGVDIVVPAPDASYKLTSGTSIAAAHVSAVAALMVGRKLSIKADEVRRILMTTAKSLGPNGNDDGFGAGLADAFEAVKSLQPETADRAPTR